MLYSWACCNLDLCCIIYWYVISSHLSLSAISRNNIITCKEMILLPFVCRENVRNCSPVIYTHGAASCSSTLSFLVVHVVIVYNLHSICRPTSVVMFELPCISQSKRFLVSVIVFSGIQPRLSVVYSRL